MPAQHVSWKENALSQENTLSKIGGQVDNLINHRPLRTTASSSKLLVRWDVDTSISGSLIL
jgi:hypothetical protein